MKEYNIAGDDLVSDITTFLELDGEGSQDAWYALRDLKEAYDHTVVHAAMDTYYTRSGYSVEFEAEDAEPIRVGLPSSAAPFPFQINDEVLPEGYVPGES